MNAYWNPMVPELMVSDFAGSLAFYQLLGFTVRFQREHPAFAYLMLGDAHLMIEQVHEDAWHVAPLERPFGRGMNLQIEVPDAQRIVDVCTSHGIVLFRPLTETWYQTHAGVAEGVRECLLQDPDGYLLRFAESLGQKLSYES